MPLTPGQERYYKRMEEIREFREAKAELRQALAEALQLERVENWLTRFNDWLLSNIMTRKEC